LTVAGVAAKRIVRQPEHLRSEIDRRRFGTAPANDLADLPNAPDSS
jgi:hypothetical protein